MKIKNPNEYIGKKYGNLTVLEIIPGNSRIKPEMKAQARCKCDCGNEKNIQFSHMKNGNTSSCGCLRRPFARIGIKLNYLTILEIFPHHYENGKRIETRVRCCCDCGIEKIYFLYNLREGNTISCGCVGKEKSKNASFKHGLSNNTLYHLWHNVNIRCYTKNSKNFHFWGGRGISNYWKNDPKGFIEYIEKELGSKPTPKHSLDRIDNNGNYEPGNLRWATSKEQAQNKTHAYQRKIEGLEKKIEENKSMKLCLISDEELVELESIINSATNQGIGGSLAKAARRLLFLTKEFMALKEK